MTETLSTREEVKRPVLLDNRTCPYCGRELSAEIMTEDHLIGRRFVPKGSLNNVWNLILKACEECNGAKSDLEDDISAITMRPDVFGQFSDLCDASVRQEALRKGAGSFSRRTGKPVSASREHFEIKSAFGSATMTFSVDAPPQVDDHRLAQLAWFHVIGCIYWLSYDYAKREGDRVDEAFLPLPPAPRSDWGNVVHRAFMRKVAGWESRLIGNAAAGNFRIAIRQLKGARCWSWALEWNRILRTIGFLGEPSAASSSLKDLPPLAFVSDRVAKDGSRVRIRFERTLEDTEDILFSELPS